MNTFYERGPKLGALESQSSSQKRSSFSTKYGDRQSIVGTDLGAL